MFRRRRFLAGAEASELDWFTPSGTAVTAAEWADGNALALAIYLDGSDDPDRADDGTLMVDDDFLVLVNAWWEPLRFTVPVTCPGAIWQAVIDTHDPARPAAKGRLRPGESLSIGPRSLVVLRAPTTGDNPDPG